MLKNKSRSSSRKKPGNRSRRVNANREWPIASVNFRGPIRTPASLRGQDLHTITLQSDGSLTSDAAGLCQHVYANKPDAPGSGLGACAQWTQLSQTFDEYRVLAYEIEYIPFDRYNRGAIITTPVVVVLDYDTATVLGSYGIADSYESARTKSLDTPWRVRISMNGIENSTFVNSLATTSTFFLKMFSSGLTPSTPYGKIFYRARIQFKNKGV